MYNLASIEELVTRVYGVDVVCETLDELLFDYMDMCIERMEDGMQRKVHNHIFLLKELRDRFRIVEKSAA